MDVQAGGWSLYDGGSLLYSFNVGVDKRLHVRLTLTYNKVVRAKAVGRLRETA